jgi:hypothetical protein
MEGSGEKLIGSDTNDELCFASIANSFKHLRNAECSCFKITSVLYRNLLLGPHSLPLLYDDRVATIVVALILPPKMKNQYFGDINDYRKYGLLRILSDEGSMRTGVCWMLTRDDGGPLTLSPFFGQLRGILKVD